MVQIERMRMQLPKGFEHRASAIARLVGELMAEINLTKNHTLERLSIRPIQVSPNVTDQEIAYSVVEQITSTLRGET